MKVIRIGKFKEQHLERIKLKEFYLKDDNVIKRSKIVAQTCPCHTLYDDETGEIVCIVGFQVFWEGVAEVWTLMSRDAEKYKMGLCRAMKDGLEHYVKALNLRRLQATCPSSLPCRGRWFEFLGFEKEGLMKRFGVDGEDYYLYARYF